MEKERVEKPLDQPKMSLIRRMRSLVKSKRFMLVAALAASIGIGVHSVVAKVKSDAQTDEQVEKGLQRVFGTPRSKKVQQTERNENRPRDGGVDTQGEPIVEPKKKEGNDSDEDKPIYQPRPEPESHGKVALA